MKIGVYVIDNILGEVDILLKEKILSKIFEDLGKIIGFQKCLNCVIGLLFKLCFNVCVEDGLINEIFCVIKMFECRVKYFE